MPCEHLWREAANKCRMARGGDGRHIELSNVLYDCSSLCSAAADESERAATAREATGRARCRSRRAGQSRRELGDEPL